MPYRVEAPCGAPSSSLASPPSAQLVHIFVTQRRKLDAILKSFSGKLRSDAAVWVSWPKRSSSEYTNVTAEVVLDAAAPLGLVGLKLVSEMKLRGRFDPGSSEDRKK